MNNRLAIAFLAIAASGVASASAITSEGYVLSAPPASFSKSTVERSAVSAEAVAQVRENIRDTIAAEGRGAIKAQPGANRTRAQVRAEAVVAARQNIQDPIAAAGERAPARSFPLNSEMSASSR